MRIGHACGCVTSTLDGLGVSVARLVLSTIPWNLFEYKLPHPRLPSQALLGGAKDRQEFHWEGSFCGWGTGMRHSFIFSLIWSESHDGRFGHDVGGALDWTKKANQQAERESSLLTLD